MKEAQLIPFPTVVLRIVLEQAPVAGRCESVCDMSFDGSDPHFCAFMEHATGRHECDRCGPRHTWGPMHPVFPPSVHAEPAPVGDLFDRIEKAAVDYRYRYRMPNDEILTVVVKGGMNALGRAAVNRGMPVVVHDQIVSWLLARKLVFVEVANDVFIGTQPDVLVYKPGMFVSEPDPDGRDQKPHSRACGTQLHAHGPACAPDCPTCVERVTP